MSNVLDDSFKMQDVDVQKGFLEFLDYFAKGDEKEAWKFKSNLIPKTLYKFFSLSDSPRCGSCGAKIHHCNHCGALEQSEILNAKKIETLENNNLWLSSFDSLNDPFEFQSLYLDKNRLRYTEPAITIFNLTRNSTRTVCFISVSPFIHMPMWAHYANNHKGFCVEYAVKNPYLLYPVHYVPKREPIYNILDRIVSAIGKSVENHQDDLGAEEQKLGFLLFLSGNVKSDLWKYEGEYRILNIADKPDEYGESLPLQKLGLEVRHIYIGKSCLEEHRVKLVEVAKKIGSDVSDVYLDEDSPEFELKTKLIGKKL